MKTNQSNIKKAKKYLNKNYCIGVPSETVYGLAANAYMDLAVKKIFNLKKRPKNNPLIVHYNDIDSLKKDCLINDNFIKLYKKFSPGPITYVLKLKKDSKISKYVTNNQKSLAVRFPKHTLFKNLLKQLDYPLAAPSANISTRLSAVKANDVNLEWTGQGADKTMEIWLPTVADVHPKVYHLHTKGELGKKKYKLKISTYGSAYINGSNLKHNDQDQSNE